MHHKSKEELLYLISRAGHENTLALVQRAIASSPKPEVALRRLIHDFTASHADDHTRARVVNYELAALAPEHFAEIRTIRQKIEKELLGLVERGVATGAFDTPDPHIATIALLSLGIDIGRWYRDGGRWTSEEIADRYTEIGLRIVGAHPSSQR